jgi:hypothetical protein
LNLKHNLTTLTKTYDTLNSYHHEIRDCNRKSTFPSTLLRLQAVLTMQNDDPILSNSPDDSDAYTDDGSLVSEAKAESAIMSKKDTRQILWSKALVVLVIILAAFATSAGVYVYTKEAEEADFQVRVSTVVYVCADFGQKSFHASSYTFKLSLSLGEYFSLTISRTKSLKYRR